MSDDDLVKKFLEERGATKVPMGERAMTESQVKRAIGYEPEKLYRFEVLLLGEDGMEWMEEVTAANRPSVREKIGEMFPESSIITINLAGTRAMEIYRSVN